MGQRGRPPHPDILTPRQWEVLALIREGRTDQQIAERLGISLDGAKYHVSEILSRLGVVTREDAAGWVMPQERRAWHRAGWAIAWKAGAAALVTSLTALAAIVGWAALEDEEKEALLTADRSTEPTTSVQEDEQGLAQLNLPPPVTPNVLTREQVLADSATVATGELADVDAQVSTVAGASRAFDLVTGSGASGTFGINSESTAWLVRFLTITDECNEGHVRRCGGIRINSVTSTRPPEIACRQITLMIREFPGTAPDGWPQSSYSIGPGLPEERCARPEQSRDMAVVLAARDHWPGDMPNVVQIDEMALSDAVALSGSVHVDDRLSAEEPVWLVFIGGSLPFIPLPTLDGGGVKAPPPTPCEALVVVGRLTGEILGTIERDLRTCVETDLP